MPKYADGITEAKVGDVVRVMPDAGTGILLCGGTYTVSGFSEVDSSRVTIRELQHLDYSPTHFELIRRQEETMNGKLTLEEAKAQRRCRVCGDPVGDGRTAWTYNFGKEYAHTACLHPSQVADIHISKEHPMPDPKPEPLVKWPEEDKHLTWTDLAVKEYFVFDIEPRRRQPVCVRTTDGYMPLMSDNGIEHFVEYMDQETVPVRRLKMIRSPQFEVI